MTDLKQCPCCGSTRIHVFAPDDGCRCWDCSLTMPNVPDWRERWNRRAGIMTVKASGTCPVCGGCDVRVIKGESQTQVACWNPECVFSIVLEGASIYDAAKLWDRLRVVE